jgi:hypothetical protein
VVLRAVEGEHLAATRHAYIVVTATYRTLPLADFGRLTRLSIPVFDKPFDVDKLVAAVAKAADRLSVPA